MAQGMAQGVAQARKEMALELIESDFSDEQIKKITKLSLEDIKRLRSKKHV